MAVNWRVIMFAPRERPACDYAYMYGAAFLLIVTLTMGGCMAGCVAVVS